MAEGERATGTPNTIYDLSSVLFHALEGGASYDTYIEDAERAGDQELAGFFRQVRDEDSNRADRAQQLLAERTSTAGRRMEGAAPGVGATEGNVTVGATEGRPDVGAAPTAEPGRIEPDVPPATEPIGAAAGTEEPLARTEEVPTRMGEAPPVTEDRPLGAEDRPIGTEGTMPPRTEEAPSRVEEVPPRTEGVSPRAEEAPLPEEEERARRAEREQEDKGLVEKAKDAILGEEEPRRTGGTDRPTDRR